MILQLCGTPYRTGLSKLGTVLGDAAEIGCSTVCNPGTTVGKGTLVYPGLLSVATIPKKRLSRRLPSWSTACNRIQLPKLLRKKGFEKPSERAVGEMMDGTRATNCVLVVGNAVAEDLLVVDGAVVRGSKNEISRHSTIGGSGLNYALRLTASGVPTLPFLVAGNDSAGKRIQTALSQAASAAKLPPAVMAYVIADDFLCEAIGTPKATILVESGESTIFYERLSSGAEFHEFVVKKTESLLLDEGLTIRGLLIGHILPESASGSEPAPTTTYLVKRLSSRAKLMVGNFGRSQLSLGLNFWKPYLHMFSVMQFTLHDLRAFLGIGDDPETVFRWLQSNGITAVITLGSGGAIACFRDGRDGLIYAPPIVSESVLDTTGAGDAFAAGLVASLMSEAEFTFEGLCRAMTNARIWAAHACRRLGGASEIPSRRELQVFEEQFSESELRIVPAEKVGEIQGLR